MDIFLSISSSAISASTLSNHAFLGLPTGLLPSTLYSIYFFTQSSSPLLITCQYHLSLPPLMKVVIGSTPTSLLNASFVFLSFNEIPHIYLIICISALSSSGCQKWQKLSELHPSISDSSCSSKIRSTISIKSVSQITKALHIHMFLHPPLGPQLDPITSSTPETVPVLHRQHRDTFQSLQ